MRRRHGLRLAEEQVEGIRIPPALASAAADAVRPDRARRALGRALTYVRNFVLGRRTTDNGGWRKLGLRGIWASRGPK